VSHPKRVVILGAAGRDFHDFNCVFRDDSTVRVVAFTAAQIPNIEGRRYPPSLAGPLYPDGIPIVAELELERLIAEHDVDDVVFSYSDVSHEVVMHHASRALASGAGFRLLAPRSTMLSANNPVVSVCAVRTGAGKSPTSRKVAALLRARGARVAIVRHPMPYGDLEKQVVQRFATLDDLGREHCTVEEMEEYEPHIRAGSAVFAGVDYARVLERAEAAGDVVLWDGGNNDLPFFRPDLELCMVDPHRAGHESRYHPGETNLRRAHVVVIGKVDSAEPEAVDKVRASVSQLNPSAVMVETELALRVETPERIRDARVLVVEDGPTTTHGGMGYGAGVVAARRYGARELVDPRPFAVGSLRGVFARYPHLHAVLPAMGYGDEQVAELQQTIARADADVVLIATPVDLGRLMRIDRPALRVRYELGDHGSPTLAEALEPFFERLLPRSE
jgi:predicted GTPase